MTQVIYFLSFVFGGIIFIAGLVLLFDGEFGTAAVVGSLGLVFAIYFYDAFLRMSDEVGKEEAIITNAKENMDNNKNAYIEALNIIESFKRRGINGGYQVYDVYERDKYEKACSIVYDYEKNKTIIENIKTKRIVRDAKTLASVVAGFVIGQSLSKMSRGEKEKK